ncbi:MAG: LapA family protein [Ignavibacteria bacterium]|jgi:uncharacterized integral membrane protein
MLKKILVVVLIIFTMIFTIQNVDAIEVNFLSYSVKMPRAFILLITLLIGVAVGLLLKLDTSKSPKIEKETEDEEDTKDVESN